MRIIGVPWHFEPDEHRDWRKVHDKEQVCKNIPKQMGTKSHSISGISGNDIYNDCNYNNDLLEVR